MQYLLSGRIQKAKALYHTFATNGIYQFHLCLFYFMHKLRICRANKKSKNKQSRPSKKGTAGRQFPEWLFMQLYALFFETAPLIPASLLPKQEAGSCESGHQEAEERVKGGAGAAGGRKFVAA